MSNRLREILLANRIDPQMAAPELCPFCQNQNAFCQYFEMDTLSTETDLEVASAASGEVGEFPIDSFWGRVKQALTGTMITLKTEGGEIAVDLGASIRCGYYYLDLFGSWAEIPLIAKIAGKFGFLEDLDEKTDKRSSTRFMAVPVPALQPKEMIFTTLDEAAQDTLDLEYMSAMDNAAEGMAGENYWDYEWMPLYFDPGEPEVDAPDIKQGNKSNALALVNWRTIYGWEETIYRRWADMEERLILENYKTAETKKEYECSDLKKARQDFVKELAGMRDELKTGIGSQTDG
jgi:hypothetical protein